MAKLYPPSIEGKLPAFAGDTLKIPITMNRGVNINQVSGMRVMVKTVQTSQLKATMRGSLSYETSTGKYYALFSCSENGFTPNLGQFYKIQVAYVDKLSEIGYYSSVGTIKYTSVPSLEIPGLTANFYGKYDYIGIYSQEDENITQTNPETGEVTILETIKRDNTEKCFSYCFELTDRDGNLIATSGVQLHDASTDQSTGQSSDNWALRRELTKDVPFYLQYKVTTTNGLEVSSAKYLVMDQDSVDIDIPLALVSEMDYENGSIVLSFYPLKSNDPENVSQTIISGSFVLIRSSGEDNFGSWNEVHRFTYSNVSLTVGNPVKLWEDCTVQQGIEYTYALQGYNSYGLYSNKIISVNKNNTSKNSVQADFEDAFLYDGERQLKIKYNPKVSSFKETVLESKLDTIGSRFPFIFRNGDVRYKEFPISGLLSLHSDPEERFLKGVQTTGLTSKRGTTPSKLYFNGNAEHHLSGHNIQRERDFKLTVLEWLNNGKPKLFRSSTEGNYIVRLMNISLSPNDTLGRMLHTFTCTAYEIAEYNFENLVNLELMSIPESNTTSLRVGQISPRAMLYLDADEFQYKYPDFSIHNETINMPASYAVNITEATPGTVVGFNFANGQGEVIIEIGDTGGYYVQIKEYPVISIRLVKGQWDDAKITFNYYDDTPSDMFSYIADFQLTDEIRQFIGTGYGVNVIDGLEDIRRDLGQFHYIRIEKRQTENIWRKGDNFFRTDSELDLVDKWDKTLLYYVVNGGYYIDGNNPNIVLRPEEIDYRFALNPRDGKDYIDLGGVKNPSYCYNCGWLGESDGVCPSCKEKVDAKFGDTFGRIAAIQNIEKVTDMYIGNGVIVDVAYRVRTKTYVIEETDHTTATEKLKWESAVKTLNDWIAYEYMSPADYERAVQQVETAYQSFVRALKTALDRRAGIL